MLYLEQGDKMNKLELIDVISKQLSLTKKDCRNVIDTFLDNIIKELQEGKRLYYQILVFLKLVRLPLILGFILKQGKNDD